MYVYRRRSCSRRGKNGEKKNTHRNLCVENKKEEVEIERKS
jgi:hypothetical protein